MIGHRSPISGVACHGDRYVATAGYDNQVILWDRQAREAVGRVLHDHLANQCAFSPDGTRLVSASSDYTARVWSVPDLRLQAVLCDHQDDVEMAVFHPNRDLIATASRDCLVRVFSGDGRLKCRLEGHGADVLSVEWMSGTTDLLSSGDDGTIRRWSVKDGCQVEAFSLGGIETDTVAVSPEGTIFAGTDAGDIVVLATGIRSSITAHTAGVKRLVLSATKGLLVSLSYDRSAAVWAVCGMDLKLVCRATLPADVWARSCAFGSGTTLMFGTFGACYRQYDYVARQWGPPPPVTLGINAVCAFEGSHYAIGDAGHLWRDGQFARDLGSLCNFLLSWGERLLTGGQMGLLFDALTGEVLYEHRSPLNCGIAYVAEGEHRTLIGTYTGEGLVFRRGSGGVPKLLNVVRLHANAVKGLAYGEGVIFSVCADTGCCWTDAATHVIRHHVKRAHTRIANACAALPGGRFVSVSRDRKVRLWEGFTAREFEAPHVNSIKCVAADASGQFVACGSYGGHLGILDLGSGRWVRFSRLSSAGVSSLFFEEKSQIFLASCYDGVIHKIELPINDPQPNGSDQP